MKTFTGKWSPVCRAQECVGEARTAGYCPRHYQQIRRHGHLTPDREYHRRGSRCRVDRCEDAQIAKGYCFRHYQQIRRYGRLTPERERIYGRVTCRVVGCTAIHSSRGYCKQHYMSEYYLPHLAQARTPVQSFAGVGVPS